MKNKLQYPFCISWRNNSDFVLINNIIDYLNFYIKAYEIYKEIGIFDHLNQYRNKTFEWFESLYRHDIDSLFITYERIKQEWEHFNKIITLIDRIDNTEVAFKKAKLIIKLFNIRFPNYITMHKFSKIEDLTK